MKDQTPVLKAHIAVLLTNLFFATNYSLVKFISPSHVGPYGLNIIRVGVSLMLFWLFWIIGTATKKHEIRSAVIRRKDMGRFALCGLTGIAINQMLFVKGLTMTSTIHASLLMLCTPLLITLFAFWILKEKVTMLKAAGLALGIGGAMLLILPKQTSAGTQASLTGDTLIILNAISYTIYFILVKPLMKEYGPLQVMRWVFTFGFIMILPFGWGQFISIDWSGFEWTHIASLGFIVIFGTFLAYVFNVYGLRWLGAGVTGSYIYTQPIFAAIVAMFVLNERLTVKMVVAGMLIFLGVYLVGKKQSSK
jgi:drug/metabolite transporter (DMT)-like permease